MNEIWKDIKGFENLYQVSNFGRVKSLPRKGQRRELVLKPTPDTKGYERVKLTKDSKGYTKKVHRLVAETFIPNPKNKPTVDHIDGNKRNNNVSNLRWFTYKEQVNDNILTKNKMAEENCKKVTCITTGESFNSVKEAKEFYNINHDHRPLNEIKITLPDGTKIKYEWKILK